MPDVDVGYGTGPATGTVYKTPFVDACPSGVTCNAGAHTFTCTSSGVTIDSWDMTVGGGVQIIGGSGCSGITVSNNKYLNGANQQPFINITSAASGGGTIINNLADGNFTAQSGIDGLIEIQACGAWVIKYNQLKNAYVDFLNFAVNSCSVSLDQEFNVLENNGSSIGLGPHPDHLQMIGTATYSPVVVKFNLRIMNRNGSDGTQGVSCQDNTFIPTCDNVAFDNNTDVFSATFTTGGVNYDYIFDTSELKTVGEAKNNYIDPTDINSGACLIRSTGSGPWNGTVTTTGNINMKTGAAIGMGC